MGLNNWKPGDIVYWMHKDGWWPKVHWGMISDVYTDGLTVDYLEPYEVRRVNNIPINEFETESRYKKLPKGWTYNTELYKITYDERPKDFYTSTKQDDPASIINAYNKGYLVKSSSIFHGEITTDITKEGYRIVKRYPVWYMSSSHKPTTATLLYSEACVSYKEAKDRCDAEIAEFKRQASLSDREWSIEQINHTLDHWKKLYGKTDEETNNVRDKLFNKPYVEDLEVRLSNNELQWKYWKNKKWFNIEN